jgi:hypothetical protein
VIHETEQAVYNVYCDESCHLEATEPHGMVIGAVWCPQDTSRAIADEMRELKIKHGFDPRREIKWTGVSPAKLPFYLDALDWFFARPDLNFRAIIIPDKRILDHQSFRQEHGIWYYKMFHDLLKILFHANSSYRIFIDIKDTHSGHRAEDLRRILEHYTNKLEYSSIEIVQNVRSHEVQQIQLTDLLIGAISYENRGLRTSQAKLDFIARFTELAGGPITESTPASKMKVNRLRWNPERGRNV